MKLKFYRILARYIKFIADVFDHPYEEGWLMVFIPAVIAFTSTSFYFAVTYPSNSVDLIGVIWFLGVFIATFIVCFNAYFVFREIYAIVSKRLISGWKKLNSHVDSTLEKLEK
jgi:hypothetical protein